MQRAIRFRTGRLRKHPLSQFKFTVNFWQSLFPLSQWNIPFPSVQPTYYICVLNMRLLLLLLLLLISFPSFGQESQAQRSQDEHIKILCIGNSFSMDATLCLPQLIVDMGVPNSKQCVYCAMYAGASLDYWWEHCSRGDTIAYLYRMSGTKLEDRPWTVAELLHLPWDVVILQQASVYSDQLETYRPYLKNMVEMVRRESANPDVTIAFQMTWSKHPTARTGPYG